MKLHSILLIFTFLSLLEILKKSWQCTQPAFTCSKSTKEIIEKLWNMFKVNNNFSVYNHCVKSICIRSYSGPFFPVSGLNTLRYSVSLRIQSECGKILVWLCKNNSEYGHFLSGELFRNTPFRGVSRAPENI